MTLCRPCAYGAYYKHVQEVDWPDTDWAPEEASPLSPLDFQPHQVEIPKARNQETTHLRSSSFAGLPFDACK
jgi:hypothetical protein